VPLSDPRENPIVRKLQATLALSAEEIEAVTDLPIQIASVRADQDIIREGDRPSRCFAVLEGFTCAYKLAAEGRRQIVVFHMPGDIPDIQSLHLHVLDTSFSTITPCKVGFIQHDALRDLCNRFPRLTSAFWRETLIDASIFREWMTSIGRRSAHARIAHLICEMVIRLRAVGLASGHTYEIPITQAEFGDALGLSFVHVNRVMKDLRKAGLISQQGRVLTVLDWDGLKRAGDFEAGYLHLRNAELAA
jgi:CRP-like cAMP-binding protein